MRALLFDLDGTLVNTISDIAFSVNTTMELLGLPQRSTQFVQDHTGYGPGALISSCVGEGGTPELVSRAQALFDKVYYENLVVSTRLYNQMAQVLDLLSVHRLAIVTNKSPRLTNKTVELLKLDRWFDYVWTKGREIPHKPDLFPIHDTLKTLGIPPSVAVMIGDSEPDILAGDRAGVETIGVTWGFRTPEQVAACKPTHLAHTPMDLVRIL